MRNRTGTLVRRLGTLILGVMLLAGQTSFCVCADEPDGTVQAGQLAEQAATDQAGINRTGISQAGETQMKAYGTGESTVTVQNKKVEIGPGVTPQLSPEEVTPVMVGYAAFQDNGVWSETKYDNDGLKVPEGNFVTSIWLTISGQPEVLRGKLTYQVYVSSKGWLEWTDNGTETSGAADQLPVEAMAMQLTGYLDDYYDIYYAVWQNGEWSQWAMNGSPAGAEGTGARVEGFRTAVVVKGGPAPEIEPEPQGIDPTKPMVALTFDDGPSTPVTSRILNSLEANGGRATFFMVGNRVPGTQPMVQRMAALGCEVGNHTYEHKYLTKIGDGGIRSQVSLTNQKIAEASGVTPTLVRPPGGYYNQAALDTLGSMGMAAIMWDIDTLDWKTKNAQNTINVVLNQVKDGDIVLMHDIYGTSADAAEVIIPELVKRGYQLVTVSEMAQYRGGITAGHVYNRFRP